MKNVIILEGKSFDWEQGNKAAKHAVDDEGNVNWYAAFGADPGVMSCPKCGTYFWREGTLVKCTECGEEWRP
jgi:hypothetical protein